MKPLYIKPYGKGFEVYYEGGKILGRYKTFDEAVTAYREERRKQSEKR